MKRFAFAQHLNWRILLLRVSVNAGTLLITAAIVPNIYFVDRRLVMLLWMAIVLGVLNALVKPIVQFLTLQFIFVTYGVVIVLINAGLLWLLSILFPSLFAVNGWFWALLGGLVMGLLSSFLEGLLGVTPPIVPEKYDSLRQRIRSQPYVLPQALVPATSPGEVSGVLATPVGAATTANMPVGTPSEPPAASVEDQAEFAASDDIAPAAAVVEDTAAPGTGPAAPRLGPIGDGSGNEG